MMLLGISNRSKESKDEKQIERLCENLNSSIGEILGTNPDFKYYGNKKNGYYSFYNRVEVNKDTHIQLKFRIHYADKLGLATRKEFELDKPNLDDTLYNRSYLMYIQLDALYLEPKGKGIGTRVFNALIEDIKHIKTLEKIMIMPADELAEKFWVKNGLRDVTIKEVKDKRIKDTFNKLVYDL